MFVRWFVRVLWGRFSPLINCPRERKSERGSEGKASRGPPTHPFSLPSSILGECARPPLSLLPPPATKTESVRVQDFFPSHSASFLLSADRGGGRRKRAVLTRPTKHPRGARRHSREGGRWPSRLTFEIAPIRRKLKQGM